MIWPSAPRSQALTLSGAVAFLLRLAVLAAGFAGFAARLAVFVALAGFTALVALTDLTVPEPLAFPLPARALTRAIASSSVVSSGALPAGSVAFTLPHLT